jgi:microcystin-dependent protein
MKRRNFIGLLAALAGVPFLPKVVVKHTLSVSELPLHSHPYTGQVLPCHGQLPKGWLPCDGRAVSRSQYNTLYSLIDTTYGRGDGFTTFNLPDMNTAHAHGIADPGHQHGLEMYGDYVIKT